MTPRTKTNHSHRVRERTFLGASPTSTSSANDARLFFFLFSIRASSRETAAGKAASSTVAAESVAPRDETTPPRPGLAGTAERDESRRSSSRDGEGETSSSIVNMANAFLWVPPLARGAAEGRVGAGADPDPVRALPCFTRRGVNPSSSSFTVPTAGTESARGSIASIGEDGGVGERTNGQRESPGGRHVGACENRVGGNLNASRATTDVPTAGSSRLSRDGAPANSSGSSSGNISLLLFFRLFPMMAMTRAAASGAEGVSKPGAAGVASLPGIGYFRSLGPTHAQHITFCMSSSNGTTTTPPRLLFRMPSPPSGTPARVGFRGTRRCLAVARATRSDRSRDRTELAASPRGPRSPSFAELASDARRSS